MNQQTPQTVTQQKTTDTNRRPKALFSLDLASLDVIYGPQEQERLKAIADFVAPPQEGATLMNNPELLEDVEVIFSGWGAPVMDDAFMAAAKNLKAVFYGAGSVRSFAKPAFWDREIILTNAAEANAVPVAEYCVATILLSMKNFWSCAQGTRKSEGWLPGAHMREVAGNFRSTAGFITIGAISRKTLELLNAFDINRLAYSRSLTPESAKELNVTPASIEEIFKTADVISLHTPNLPATQGMIKGEHFEMMKPGATFINTARGAVVNEKEMCEVLAKRPDITAVLDVTAPEPPVPGSPVETLPNVVLTPHLAGSAGPECQRLGYTMLQEFERYLAGESLEYQVTKEAFDQSA
ncbi:MAG: hydroxyacid dehydrogenase [Opitutaceae bacterium]